MRGRRSKSNHSPAVAQRKRWYSTARWKRARARVLAGNPVCAICHVAPATQADHVVHLPDNSTFWNLDNLRPACATCNNRLGATARQSKSGGGSFYLSAKGSHTAPGSKITDTAGKKADHAADIFNRFKGASNAKPND